MTTYISREEVEKIFTRYLNLAYNTNYNKVTIPMFQSAGKEILSLPPLSDVASPQWIPVSERLPEEEDGYMLYSENIGICEGWFCKSEKIWENWNTKKIKEVTHWQPLPLPPQ